MNDNVNPVFKPILDAITNNLPSGHIDRPPGEGRLPGSRPRLYCLACGHAEDRHNVEWLQVRCAGNGGEKCGCDSFQSDMLKPSKPIPCDKQYWMDGDLYSHCGRALGHGGECGRND